MENYALIILGVLILAFSTNVPVAFALGSSVYATLMITGILPMGMPVQKFFTSGDSFPLLAIPFFVLAGEIMARGGISRELIKFGKSILGGVPGSLGMITIFACGIFAAISGAGPATVAAIGGIMVPYMVADRYDRAYASTLSAAGGCLGPIIPPSIPMVLYGITSNQSITDMFIAGIGPGLLLTVSLMTTTFLISKKNGFGPKDENFEFSSNKVLKSAWDAKWALLMPGIILGGIYTGVFTPTEAAVVACVYGLIVALFITKELKIKDLPQTFQNAALTNGTAVIMVGCAYAFGEMLTMLHVPATLATFIQTATTNKFIVLILCNVLLLFAGMFFDTIAAVLIFAPIMMTIVAPYGISEIHFGIILITNLVIGQITPPVGVNLFVASKIGGVSVDRMFGWLPIILTVLIIDVLIITFVPQLSLFLLSL